jgi:PAS domain S-box-containing protein
VFDSSGRLVRWNDKLSGMLGLSDERMAALDALETIHVADRSAVREKIRQAFQQGAATTLSARAPAACANVSYASTIPSSL